MGQYPGRRNDGMAKLHNAIISKRTVEALEVEKDTVFWDHQLKGFGVRVYASGSKYYVAQTRGPDGPKRVTVGRHGVITADQARRRAVVIIARIKAGQEPVGEQVPSKPRHGQTVAKIAARYLDEHVAVRCKPRTEEMYRLTIEKYILPALRNLSTTLRQ